MNTKLSELTEGESCIVTGIYTDKNFKRRLNDLGLTPGTKILCLNKSPSGDPVAYLIRGTVIAIRDTESSMISVNPLR